MVNKLFKDYVLIYVLAGIALLSLLYAQFIVPTNPDFAFYLLPTRAWELVIGGLATFYSRDNLAEIKAPLKKNVRKFFPLVGLFLIAYSFFFMGSEIQHPSFITLIPVIGVCFILMFSNKGEITNKLFSIRPLVYIGLISYSLYLWHQPVFVFFRVLRSDNFNFESLMLLLVISLFLAVFTYHFVEFPYRKRKVKIRLLIILILLIVFNVISSYIFIKYDGLPSRYRGLSTVFQNINGNLLNKVNDIKCQGRQIGENCEYFYSKSKKTLILIGDSNAGALGYSLLSMARKNKWNYAQVTSSSCATLPGVYRDAYNKSIELGIKPTADVLKDDNVCKYNGDLIISYVKSFDNVSLIYTSHQERYEKGYNETAKLALEDLAKNVNELILLYPIPLGQDDIKRALLKLGSENKIKRMLNESLFLSTEQKTATKGSEGMYETLNKVKGDNIIRYYMRNYFCDGSKCITHNDKNIFYYNKNHISIHGAEFALKDVVEHLRKESKTKN